MQQRVCLRVGGGGRAAAVAIASGEDYTYYYLAFDYGGLEKGRKKRRPRIDLTSTKRPAASNAASGSLS